MKIFNIKWLLLLMAVTMFSSCLYEDRGNYDYTQINDVTIEDIDDSKVFDVVAGADVLEFNPKLTFAQDANPSEDRYEYEWLVMPKNDIEASTVIGTEKNLKWVVEGIEGLHVGLYKVHDKVADLTWSKQFFFKITSTTRTGWMVLCDQNGLARVDMIGFLNETRHVVAHDLIRGTEIVGRPLGLAFAYSRIMGGAGGNETILYGENGTYSISPDFYMDESYNYKYEFISRVSRVDLRAFAKTWGRSDGATHSTYLIDKNGDLYVKYHYEVGAMYGVKKNLDPSDKTKYIKLAPFIGFKWAKGGEGLGGPNPTTLVYGEETKTLYQLNYGVDTPAEVLFTADYVEGWTEEKEGVKQTPSNLGHEMLFMGSNYINNDLSETYAVMKNAATAQTYLYGMVLLKDQNVKPFLYQELTAECPEMAKAKLFALSPIYKHIYYAVGNILYCYNLNSKSNYKMAEFAGETIAAISFQCKIGWTTSESWETNNQYKLVVATNKKIGGDVTIDNCGVVRIYDKIEWLNQEFVLLEQFNDFGNIITITHKEKQVN